MHLSSRPPPLLLSSHAQFQGSASGRDSINKSKENQLEGVTNKQALPSKLIFWYETVPTRNKKGRYKSEWASEKLAMRKRLPQLTKRKLCLSATHMPWHSEQARNKRRSRDDDFIRGSKKEKYDWNARQASSAGETRQEARFLHRTAVTCFKERRL